MSHQWLMEMLSQRIEDKALLNLINQWLKARVGTKETGFTKPDKGSPQGGIISPVLANIYLHYALDLWFEKRVKPSLEGKAMLIRYADDFVVAFQYQHEAKAFYQELPERLKKFGLEVAEEKTHLKRFSRFQMGKERSFQFLGFEFYWDRDMKGMPIVRRWTATKRHNATLKSIDEWIKSNRSKRLNRFMPMLKWKLTGFGNYFGLPDNSRSVNAVYDFVLHSLYKWLNRRSYNCQGFKAMLRYFQIEPLRVVKRSVQVDWY
jgi:RNA-directed DNA polymerase